MILSIQIKDNSQVINNSLSMKSNKSFFHMNSTQFCYLSSARSVSSFYARHDKLSNKGNKRFEEKYRKKDITE